MNNSIAGKRILFFGLETMGYERMILKKMQEMKARVDYFSERPVSSQLGKAIIKVAPNLLNTKTEEYYYGILKKIRHIRYDIILIMKCDTPTRKVLESIRELFPNAQLRLHLWDSLVNIPNIERKLDLFDRISSFDRKDCIENKEFLFRPLFYNDQIAEINNEKKEFDISFCGTIHSDRYEILKSINKQCENNGMRFYGYYYMQSKLAYYYLKLRDIRFRKVPISELEFETLGYEDVKRIFSRSVVIVDIQHPNQTGLTMRTIETLGAKKKLITTNDDIKHYDFYDKNNICIIDRNNPVINVDFFKTPYHPVDDKVYKRYSLQQWIQDVLMA